MQGIIWVSRNATLDHPLDLGNHVDRGDMNARVLAPIDAEHFIGKGLSDGCNAFEIEDHLSKLIDSSHEPLGFENVKGAAPLRI